MPIKLKTSDGWRNLSSLKLKRTDPSTLVKEWRNVTKAYLKVAGVWRIIFGSLNVPTASQSFPPLLYFRDTSGYETSSSEIAAATQANLTYPAAFDADKIFLTRGRWSEEPTSFYMRIQKSQSASFSSGVTTVNGSSSVTRTYSSYSDSDYEDEVPLSSANRYPIDPEDVRDGYYFRGYIEATNDDNLTGTYSTGVILPRRYANVSFTQNLDTTYGTSIQTNGGTFTWSYSGNSTIQAQDISQQEFYVYPLNNTSVDALYYTGVFPGTGTNNPVTTVTFTSANLSPNTQYTIVIKSTMQDGWVSNTNSALRTIITDQESFTTSAAKPAAPTGVTGTDVGTNRPYNNGAVSLSWTQPNNGVAVVGYKIEYAQGPGYITYSTLVANTGNNTTSGTFTGLLSNTNYKFVVTAIGSAQNSDPSADSNIVLITTVPDRPTGVSAVAGNASADVSFSLSPAPANGGKSILDYRATSTPGGITGSDTVSPIPVTGLTNYTEYTFTVAARNANGYSAESIASNSVTPQLPAPVGSGSVTIASNSASNYIFQITAYGTWSNSATSYDYQWQTSSDGGSNWTTRSSGTAVTTIPNYDAVSQKTHLIRLRVFGRNQTGAAVSPLTSNSLTVFYTSPIITSLTVTGGAGLLIWNFAYSADDPVVDIDLEYKLSSSSTYTLIPVTTTSGQEIVAAGTYDFRVFITNSVNGAFRSDFETVTNIVVTGAPTASGFARSDSTVIPSQPSTLSFSSSNNQVTTSWTNGSPITSVNFAASGAGVNTNYTDTSAPFITSDLSNYSSSGTYTATVTNFNNSLQVRASWNQSNSQSYQVNYSSSVFGSDQTAIINNSGSSVNHDIGWSSGMGSFTFQSVTLWSGANGTGTSNTFTTGLTAITPTQKSSSRSGSVSLTYSLPKLATPTGVLASDNRTDGINVTWNAVSGAAYYGVWYGPTPSYDSPPDFENITSTSYLDTSMGAGVTRNYYVQAFRSGNPAGTKSDWGGPDSGTRVAPVSIPSGGSVSLTGGSTAGSIITASTSGWSGSPTSYDVYITTALSPNIPTSSSSRVASSGGGSSTTYTITSSDAISPVNIFRAFATASNSAGTSGTVQSSNTITTTSSSPATQPGTPGTPTNGWTGGTTYPFSWTAPGAGTVAGGGAATITNYSMRIYEATNSSGTGATLISTFNTGSGSSSYTYTSPNAANYYAASVAAINSAGLQGPYSGISQYK